MRVLRAYPEDMPLVLACLTGRRSGELASLMIQHGIDRVANLEGGVLGWQAAGLPVCGAGVVDPDRAPRIASLADLPRRIVSCFVAEAAEAALDADASPLDDPRAIVETLLATARSGDGLHPAAVIEALERLGEIARLRGHPIENIAKNLDAMREAVRPFLRA